MRRRASPLSRIPLPLLLAALLLLGAAPLASSQDPARAYLDWRTLQTPHFRFHYPVQFERWALDAAEHMEGVDSAVSRLVGFTPTHRVDIVIDDPYNLPNGYTLPFIDSPVITFWPVPPTPRQAIGNVRTWGEMLSVHEFAHMAHLARPSRNPLDRLAWALLPADVGPLVRKLPRWAIEGYATYVEGQVTGSGRPNGAWRAAVLRQWALEGRLPTYAQLSDWGAFEGQDFAYLAGSAFLEWLAQQQGDSSLVHVWRRATARVERPFDDAFAGVFGDSPRALYGRFAAQLTAQATDAERAVAAQGVVAGHMVQHLDWATGDPALSPDGQRVAIVLRSAAGPPRTVVWSTKAPPPDTAAERRQREMLARDPEDVAARRFYPAPRSPIATLRAVDGRGFVQPRFLPDGRRVLVSHLTAQANGTMRPDLYIWDTARGGLRRVTYDAAIQDADPSPDGRMAVATRCAAGSCDVVRVDLESGRVTTLLAGTPERSYFRPRFSPDGTRFVVSASANGHWELLISDRDGRRPSALPLAGDANRYDATFTPAGDALVYTSDRGGMINLAEFDFATRAERTLTRVTGAAVAPAVDPADGSVWFLSLHAGGYDLRRLPRDTAAGTAPDILGRFGAASPPLPQARNPMPTNPVVGPTPYGLGPRHTRYLPGETVGADGTALSVSAVNTDVIGRLTGLLTAAVGTDAQWHGAAVALAWRGERVALELNAHWAAQTVSRGPIDEALGTALDGSRRGAALAATFQTRGDLWGWRARAGAGAERLSLAESAWPLTRTDAFAEWDGTLRQSSGTRNTAERLAVHVDGGRTGLDDVARAIVGAWIGSSGLGPVPFSAHVTYGRMSGSTLASERFAAGGFASPLVDSSLTAARFAMPALPTGAARPSEPGTQSALLAYRAALPFGFFTPFYEGVSVSSGTRFSTWHRAFGIEARMAMGRLSQAYLPGFDIRLGVARSLDAPFAARTTLFSTVRYTP